MVFRIILHESDFRALLAQSSENERGMEKLLELLEPKFRHFWDTLKLLTVVYVMRFPSFPKDIHYNLVHTIPRPLFCCATALASSWRPLCIPTVYLS
jgi:hypothetical protein